MEIFSCDVVLNFPTADFKVDFLLRQSEREIQQFFFVSLCVDLHQKLSKLRKLECELDFLSRASRSLTILTC